MVATSSTSDLDHLISQFQQRFTHASRTAASALLLLPANLEGLDDKAIQNLVATYGLDLPAPEVFVHETRLWKRSWNGIAEKPRNLDETLRSMNTALFPSITMLLRLLLLLPVSARSHSAL